MRRIVKAEKISTPAVRTSFLSAAASAGAGAVVGAATLGNGYGSLYWNHGRRACQTVAGGVGAAIGLAGYGMFKGVSKGVDYLTADKDTQNTHKPSA